MADRDFGSFDHEYVEAIFLDVGGDNGSYHVMVYAVGGGTIGKSYYGNNWGYQVTDTLTGKEWSGTDFYSGSAMNHITVAIAIVGMIDATEHMED